MLNLDGSFGEGGGQILRSALALSLVTGKVFRLENIRAKRKKPGLLHQHLTAVQAATEIGRAEVDGAALGSRELTFEPGEVTPGEYFFSVGTAGSATLVLQAVLPALVGAAGPSQLTLEGGTHNPFAPPFDYLDRAFVPLVNRMGPTISMDLLRPGFYPAGGGRFRVRIQPTDTWQPLHLESRKDRPVIQATALVAKLPRHVAERELKVIGSRLSVPKKRLIVEETTDSLGPGNAVMIEITRGDVTEVFTGFGKIGVKAESVAAAAVREAKAYLAADVPVGPHLADQLLIPLALAGSGSFETLELTPHTTTNIEVVRRFLDVEVTVQEVLDKVRRVEVAKP